VLTVRPSPKFLDTTIEILDAHDEVAGTFKRKPLSAASRKPLWIEDRDGERRLKVVPDPDKGGCLFQTAEGRSLGEVLTESAYEGKKRMRWFRRGDGRYVLFKKDLDARPRDKLLLLGAALGIDLLEVEDEDD